mmetsp:Transcript_74069/g.197453  ORF Transcript_74069/g.197453 Transcript_74069/m.197453 type:complete len:265 (+) Transcript_74069:1676-2470(+)
MRYSLVDDLLEVDHLASAHHTVGSDEDLGLGVQETSANCLGRETTEHNRVHSTNTGACQHGDGELENHGKVDGHNVALLNTKRLQNISELADLILKLLVGHILLLSIIALPNVSNLVAKASLHMPVNAVVRHVGFATQEPLDLDGALSKIKVDVVNLVPRSLPVEILGNGTPESLRVLNGLAVKPGVLCHAVDVGVLHRGRGGIHLILLGLIISSVFQDLAEKLSRLTHHLGVGFVNANNILSRRVSAGWKVDRVDPAEEGSSA